MRLLAILPVISVVSAALCSELFSVVEEETSCMVLQKCIDTKIRKALTANLVENITVYPQTCAESTDRQSGVQVIHPQPGFGKPFQAFCDQEYDGGGWTVIQNRFDGSVLFFQDWSTYENGFGNLNGEFWLGLRKIHELTNSKEHELAVLLEDWDGDKTYARYSRFAIAGPMAKYRILRVGNYSGNAGDLLSPHLDWLFSTFDNENDVSHASCAENFKSAWWFQDCFYCNLNGWYWEGEGVTLGIRWSTTKDISMRRTRMMIRAKHEQ